MSNLQEVSEVVMLAGEHVMTDSRKVAPRFRKRHGDVLRAYDRLDCDEDFNRRNFASVTYIDAKGEMRRSIQMTKDGFMLLVMGFTGREATKAKVAFINAFNEMAEFLSAQANGALARWQVAYLEYRHDQDHASRCGKDLAMWRARKLVHVARLEKLDPQIKLPLIERAEIGPHSPL